MTGEFLEDFGGSKLANLNTPFVRDLKKKKTHTFFEKESEWVRGPLAAPVAADPCYQIYCSVRISKEYKLIYRIVKKNFEMSSRIAC